MNLPELDFRRTPVTLVITAVALAFELLSTFDSSIRHQLYNDLRLGLWWQVWLGEIWRPVTTTILHGGLLHALFNVYWTLVFGVALESYFRSLKFLAIVVAIAFASSMTQYLFTDPSRGMVGLSGVVYGLFGLLWFGRRFVPDWYYVCPPDVVRILVAWFFICIVLTEFGVLPVANIAHGAGLVIGICFAVAIFDRKRRPLGLAGLGLLIGGTVASLFYAPWHKGFQTAQRHRLQQHHLRNPADQMQEFWIELRTVPTDDPAAAPAADTDSPATDPPAASSDAPPSSESDASTPESPAAADPATSVEAP